MAQILVPVSDIAFDTWATNGPNFFGQLDETTAAHDGDTTRCVVTIADDFLILGITAAVDPGVNTGHVLRIVARTVSAPVNNEIVRFFVRQGTTPVGGTDFLITSTSYVIYDLAMGEAEADEITNYADLNFIISFVNNPAGNALRITAAELEIPSPADSLVIKRRASQRALLRR